MAIVSPALVSFVVGQDCSITVTLSPAENASAWTVEAKLRAYNGGTVLATGSVVGSALSTAPVWTITFTDDDLTQPPGAYVWEFVRTDAGAEYPIVEPSAFILRPTAASAYPTLTNLSEYLVHSRSSVTPNNATANQLIQLLFASEEQVKQYLGRDLAYRATYTEYYDGNGQTSFRLRRWPVTPASVAIYEDLSGNYGQTSGAFAAATALTLGTEYSVPIDSKWGDALNYSGKVERINSVWPCRYRQIPGHLSRTREILPGCLKVTYTAGFQLIPYTIKEAIWNLCTLKTQLSIYGRFLQSESGEGYSYSMGAEPAGMPDHIAAILNLYASADRYIG